MIHDVSVRGEGTSPEHDERSGADAADADHFACHVDDRESLQELSEARTGLRGDA